MILIKILNIATLPVKFFLIGGILAYKFLLSPRFGHCRFTPTCSSYSLEAIKQYGAVIGTYLAVKRIIRCSPLSKGGYDPVPFNMNSESMWLL